MGKRSWINEKEMDEFNHVTGDQIRSMTDLRKLKKLERYMREEGFPQTAEAAYETIVKLGGRVLRPGEPDESFDEHDEEFDGFLKSFDTWKDSIKDADDKLRQLQRVKANKLTEIGDNGSRPEHLPRIRKASGTPNQSESCTKKTPKEKDVRSGREYYESWDKFAATCENEVGEDVATRRPKKTKESNVVKSKSLTEREWLANREREKGNEMFKAKEYMASLDAYTLSIELFSKSPVSYANRAAVQLKMNRWDDAIADCTRALELDPKFLKALMRRGAACLELGRPEEALKDITAALELDPACTEIMSLKQRAERAVQKRQEETEKDSKLLSKKIEIEEIESIEETQGLELEKQVENHARENAAKHFKPQMQATCPVVREDDYVPMRTGPMIIEEIAETKTKLEEDVAGHEKCHAAVDGAKEAAESERIVGNEHFKCKNYCEAIKCYNKSLSLDPDVAATLSNRALCYLKLKDWNKAKSDCTEAINLDIGYAKAYYRRALASEGLSNLRGALKDLQAAHKLLPEDNEVSEKLRTVKRKLRVAFVKEVAREEAENVKRLDEDGRISSVQQINNHIGETGTVEKINVSNKDEQVDEVQSRAKSTDSGRITTVPAKPRTAIEFQRSCERLQQQPELLRKFISSIHVDDYPGIFKENMSADIMRIILKSLQVAFMPHDPAGTMAVLGGLVKVKRFGLILKLLSSSEKSTFLSIFDWLRDACGAPLDRAQELKAQFY